MRQLDRPDRPQPPGFARFNDPVTLVCASLTLALAVMWVRIVGVW